MGSTAQTAETSPKPVAQEAEKKSIAVLPFVNMSNDPEQEYFSDGLTEDLITDLSRVSSLFVIARNSTFIYKGQAINVKDVGRELGVRYVLEGSVRRVANRIRVNAQFIDVATGMHLWADRYDRELTDVFALQDEVTRTIVAALAVSLTEEDEARMQSVTDTSPEAYDTLLRGNALFSRYNTEDNVDARDLFAQAIALDPNYARAHANLALTHAVDVLFSWVDEPEKSIRIGIATAEEARRIDDSLPQIHFTLANLYGAEIRWDLANQAARRGHGRGRAGQAAQSLLLLHHPLDRGPDSLFHGALRRGRGQARRGGGPQSGLRSGAHHAGRHLRTVGAHRRCRVAGRRGAHASA